MNQFAGILGASTAITLTGVPEGYDALIIGDLARAAGADGRALLHIARDDTRLASLQRALSFYAPDVQLVHLPAWDCLPYDRVSPHPSVASARLNGLRRLIRPGGQQGPLVVLSTVNAMLQRVPAREQVARSQMTLQPGQRIPQSDLINVLAENGYEHTDIVMEPGEFAVRGGLIDVFSAGQKAPVRFDFFGDTLESLRSFDPSTQRTSRQLKTTTIGAVSDIVLTKANIARFRSAYVSRFGAVTDDDPLYASISAGRRFQGMEHLSLIHI